MPKTLSTGTLGNTATFAGEATRRLRELYPILSEPVYFPSMQACWQAVERGTVDAIVLGTERTGQPHQGQPVITSGLYVIGQVELPLACTLYVKPGTRKENIRKITGHGSIHQCVRYLDREFPGIPREMHALNSVAAAGDVVNGDGTLAVVGTRSLPELVPGLEVLATGIDEGGAFASWWAVTREPMFSPTPDFIVVTARLGPDGELGRLITAIQQQGFAVRAVATFPVHEGVSIYDYMISFTGRGNLKAIQTAMSPFPAARLAGAFERPHARS